MNGLILSFLVCLVGLFHMGVRPAIRRGKIREGLCAVWCVDALFAIGGTIVAFRLYHYTLGDFISLQNALWLLIYIGFTILFFLLAPSGLSLLKRQKPSAEEELLLSEYRFHDMALLLQNYLLFLLFALPIITALLPDDTEISLFTVLKNTESYGGFCFAAFLVLLPLSIRQALFWLKNLSQIPSETAQKTLKEYRLRLLFHKKNRFL